MTINAKRLKNERGFTLVEVLIVIVVLGVLAGVAIPVYKNNVEQSKADEVKVNLYTIYTAEKVYKAGKGVYWGPGTVSVATINSALSINLATPKYYPTFRITLIGAGFTATESQ